MLDHQFTRQRRIAALCGNGTAFITARDTATVAGELFVPINPRLAPPEIAHIVERAAPAEVLVAPELLPVWNQAASLMDSPPPHRTSWPAPRCRPAAGDIGATLLFTSGTTGRPKACLRTASQEAARAAELIHTYAITADDVHLIACPLAHSAPGIFLRAGRSVGATTIVLPQFRPEEFLEAVAHHRATLFFLVPTQYERLLALPEATRSRYDLGCVRAAIVAGAPTAIAAKRRLVDWLGHGKLWEFYGSSETGTVTVLRPEQQLTHPGSVGRPPAGVRLALLNPSDPARGPVPTGEVGEVYVGAASVMAGYLQEPDTRHDGLLSVGDLGRLDEHGYLYLVDRKHDTIISGGMNIYPAEVERALREHPLIAGAVVFGLPDPEWGQIVAAGVAPVAGAELDPVAVRQFLRGRIAAYKLPKAIAILALENLPVGASGKPLRRRAAQELTTSSTLRRLDRDIDVSS